MIKRICAISVVTTLAALLLGGCAAERDEQQKMLADMRLEIDQLTNAVGRLEFRVAQLEDQLNAATVSEAATMSDPADTAAPPVEIEPGADDKRYDLAPVE